MSYDPTTGAFICVRRTGLPPLASGRVYCPLFGHMLIDGQVDDVGGQSQCRWSGKADEVAEHLEEGHGRRYDRG